MAPSGSRSPCPLPFRQAAARPDSGSEDTETTSQHARRMASRPSRARARPTFDELSDTSSVASLTSSISPSISKLPDLTRGSSVASSTRSAMATSIASAYQNGCVLESDDGILTLPHPDPEENADLLCPFQILDCTLAFSSVRTFKIHVFSHFRGHPLPTNASCFLCNAHFTQTEEDDPALAWNNMLGHMAHDHFRRGQEFGTFRADFGLMRWMYNQKIIDDRYFKRAQICPAPILLPLAASRRASMASSITTSEAPTPPSPGSPELISPTSPTSPSSIVSGGSVGLRRLSAYGNRPYIQFAGARAERRRRDSTMARPVVMHASVV